MLLLSTLAFMMSGLGGIQEWWELVKAAGVELCGSFQRDPPVPSMMGPDGVEAFSAICRLGLRLGYSQLRKRLVPRGRRQPEQRNFQKAFVRTGESPGNGLKGKGKLKGLVFKLNVTWTWTGSLSPQ